MAKPSLSDLKFWVGTLFTKNEWDYNFSKIVGWFSDGSADLVVNTITTENGIDLNGSRLTNVGAATSGTDAVNLDTAETLLLKSSYYDLFTVCSGKEDSSGNSAYLQKDSDTQVTILAGNVNPDLTLCQSDGTVETLTSNTVLTVGSSDDTYYIIKEKGEDPIITSANFGIGKALPTSDIGAGDYFLDNSSIPFKAYKYDAVEGWVLTPFCYLGKVEKSSGTATVTPVSFDDNKYNLNVYNMGSIMPDYAHGVAKSIGVTYTASEDGWLGVAITGQRSTGYLYINGISVAHFYHDDDENRGASWSGIIPIAKGNTYIAYSTAYGLTFYPCL